MFTQVLRHNSKEIQIRQTIKCYHYLFVFFFVFLFIFYNYLDLAHPNHIRTQNQHTKSDRISDHIRIARIAFGLEF